MSVRGISAAASPEKQTSPQERSVQNYIDETPVWADGTALQSTSMTAMQWRIWSLAAAVGTSLLGAIVTWLFRIDTTGVNLEKIGN